MEERLLRLFPPGTRELWKQAAGEETQIREIRLRAEKPVILSGSFGERFLRRDGRMWCRSEGKSVRDLVCYSADEINAVLQYLCQYSPYAFEEELRRGFLRVAGGHRVGVVGQVVAEGGQIQTIKNVSGLNIRISHQIRGAADQVLPFLYREGELLNTLIISPPGCGKTTMLRDLIRQVSDGNRFGEGLCVGVVDERSELAGCFQGIPQNDLGIRTDVLDACPKALGMMMLLRSMAPQVIAVDEIGTGEDAEALYAVSSGGSRLLATVHGAGPEDVLRKDGMERLLREGIFRRFIILEQKQGFSRIKEIRNWEGWDITEHDVQNAGRFPGGNRESGVRILVS